MHVHIYIYIYIYIHVCVCVFVCVCVCIRTQKSRVRQHREITVCFVCVCVCVCVWCVLNYLDALQRTNRCIRIHTNIYTRTEKSRVRHQEEIERRRRLAENNADAVMCMERDCDAVRRALNKELIMVL